MRNALCPNASSSPSLGSPSATSGSRHRTAPARRGSLFCWPPNNRSDHHAPSAASRQQPTRRALQVAVESDGASTQRVATAKTWPEGAFMRFILGKQLLGRRISAAALIGVAIWVLSTPQSPAQQAPEQPAAPAPAPVAAP